MYVEIDQVLPADQSNDWKKFFLTDSNGIKNTGQLFLQKAVEAYVYCVLGAQANTRWKIVGAGAKSLQTQEAFAKLAKETVAQDDDTVLISNMRTAVKATNVVLNLAILPRMILIPSDLLILKKKIPGYNNTLTIATKTMSFGKNEKINFSEETSTETSTEGLPLRLPQRRFPLRRPQRRLPLRLPLRKLPQRRLPQRRLPQRNRRLQKRR